MKTSFSPCRCCPSFLLLLLLLLSACLSAFPGQLNYCKWQWLKTLSTMAISNIFNVSWRSSNGHRMVKLCCHNRLGFTRLRPRGWKTEVCTGTWPWNTGAAGTAAIWRTLQKTPRLTAGSNRASCKIALCTGRTPIIAFLNEVQEGTTLLHSGAFMVSQLLTNLPYDSGLYVQ